MKLDLNQDDLIVLGIVNLRMALFFVEGEL